MYESIIPGLEKSLCALINDCWHPADGSRSMGGQALLGLSPSGVTTGHEATMFMGLFISLRQYLAWIQEGLISSYYNEIRIFQRANCNRFPFYVEVKTLFSKISLSITKLGHLLHKHHGEKLHQHLVHWSSSPVFNCVFALTPSCIAIRESIWYNNLYIG